MFPWLGTWDVTEGVVRRIARLRLESFRKNSPPASGILSGEEKTGLSPSARLRVRMTIKMGAGGALGWPRGHYLGGVGTTLSCRSGDDVPRGLVGDGRSDPGHELWRVAPYDLQDARAKLVEEVQSRVAANRRTEIVECLRTGARPIGTVSSVDRDRSQHSEEIRSVQPPLAGVVTGDENARSCVGGPAHKAAAGRRVITQVLLEQRRNQVLIKKAAGVFLSKRRAPSAPTVRGKRVSLTNVRNSSVCVGGWTDDGASGSEEEVGISWGCIWGEFELSDCNC